MITITTRLNNNISNDADKSSTITPKYTVTIINSGQDHCVFKSKIF